MKFAYFGFPHTGGTHTVFRSLRSGLAAHNIDVFWLGLGPAASAALNDPRWVADRHRGVVLAGDSGDDKRQAKAFADFLESGACDGVFVNVLSGRVAANAMRYVTPPLNRVMIVHNITPGTYAAARAIKKYVHTTIGVSPRIRADLIANYGFLPERTHAIPNAVDVNRFARVKRAPAGAPGPLRVLSLGRVVNADKGVFWFPDIIGRLPRGEVLLTVAGDGPDLPALKRRCAHLGARISFIGRVAPEQVPAVLAQHDVFLFPSRFEGLPTALVEAMAAGCVPVAARLKGVTDFVIQNGETGLLFNVGDARDAAQALASLATNRSNLARLSAAARLNVSERFSLATMAARYADVVSRVAADPPRLGPALSLADWAYPAGLRPGLRRYIPKGIKNYLRVWRERLV